MPIVFETVLSHELRRLGVTGYLDQFAEHARADELMLSIQDADESSLLESLEIVSQSKFQSPNPS